MKNALIIVGKELKLNSSFVAYLKREVTKSIGIVDMTLFIGKNDESISADIKEITNKYQHVIIATTEAFELVGKILSTQTLDSLVYKQKMLLPSKVIEIEEDSYKLKNINVLRIHVDKKIPKILLQSKKECVIFLFCDKSESSRFEKLAHVFEVETLGIKIVDEVWKYSLSSQNEIGIDSFLNEVRELITDKMIVGDNLFSSIAHVLIESNRTISHAESCTGGLISSELVKNSGVSSIFKGSIVSYSNEVKSRLVGVKKDTLENFGAVSSECVAEMLDGVMKEFDSDFSLAVSGVAGPDGGSLEKPVGTIIIGAKKQGKSAIIKKISLKGDRIFIQQSAMFWALKLLVLSDEEFFFKFMSKTLDK